MQNLGAKLSAASQSLVEAEAGEYTHLKTNTPYCTGRMTSTPLGLQPHWMSFDEYG